MTQGEALKEAKKRWGKNAYIDYRRPVKKGPNGKLIADPAGRIRYLVGRIMLGIAFEVMGQGNTWQEAFNEADAEGNGRK